MIRRLLFFATFAFLTGIECAFFETTGQWADYRMRVAEIRAAEFKEFPANHPPFHALTSGISNTYVGNNVAIGYQAIATFPSEIKSKQSSLRRRPR